MMATQPRYASEVDKLLNDFEHAVKSGKSGAYVSRVGGKLEKFLVRTAPRNINRERDFFYA